MTPRTKDAQKLSEPLFMVRRQTPIVDTTTPEYTSPFPQVSTPSATWSFLVRLESTTEPIRLCKTSRQFASSRSSLVQRPERPSCAYRPNAPESNPPVLP